MMRSLFSGVAGLRTHQTRMDVIGNNIANVNTVAYKSSNATFQELMYQTTQNASAANPDTGRGGVNARQIGLGTSVGAINTNISAQGASQTTGNALDLQISGDAFFVVSDGSSNFFTRAGAFYIDGAGNLAMTSNGFIVQGWQPNDETVNDPDDVIINNVSPLQIMKPENMISQPEQTKNAYIDGVIDVNDSALKSTDGRMVNISLYDKLGYNYTAQFAIRKEDDGTITMEAKALLDSTGKDILGTGTPAIAMGLAGAAGTPPKLTLEFDENTGKLITPALTAGTDGEHNVELSITGIPAFATDAAGATADPITVNFGPLTMYDNNKTSSIAGHGGTTAGGNKGRKLGAMSGVAIQQDGKIYAAYDNGTTKLLGQIAVASFANPSGLEKVGDNLYQTTQNSGAFDGIGKDITADGSGKMNSGVLEMSNVDLSAEFTDMITTQRGFQANSRIITVSDTMLEELINLKR